MFIKKILLLLIILIINAEERTGNSKFNQVDNMHKKLQTNTMQVFIYGWHVLIKGDRVG